MTEGRRRVRVLVHGRVQGVAFRAATADRARRVGVAGWVRNLPDGSVEAAFEGDASAVETLLGFVREGPPAARVERVETRDETPRDEAAFRIEH